MDYSYHRTLDDSYHVVQVTILAESNWCTTDTYIHTYIRNSYLEWPNAFDKLLNHYRDAV